MIPHPPCWKHEALLCLYPCPGSLFGFVQHGTVQHSRAHEGVSLAPVAPSRRWLVHDLSPSLPFHLFSGILLSSTSATSHPIGCQTAMCLRRTNADADAGDGKKERKEKSGETFTIAIDSSP
jgi:hypothetical protein